MTTPTIHIRRADERGFADHGWLRSFHSFSFADYHDPKHMGFRNLRVINEDRVAPGRGFGRHPHRDMEIISYVLDGSLEHRDSMGNGSVIRPGEVQRMSAGTGVFHSEFNGSQQDQVHFLQIWILPKRRGIQPGYEQKLFEPDTRRDKLRLVADPEGREGALTIHADARLYAGLIGSDRSVEHVVAPGRHAWVQVARGSIELAGHTLVAGDGAAIDEAGTLTLIGRSDDAEVLVFDLI